MIHQKRQTQTHTPSVFTHGRGGVNMRNFIYTLRRNRAQSWITALWLTLWEVE